MGKTIRRKKQKREGGGIDRGRKREGERKRVREKGAREKRRERWKMQMNAGKGGHSATEEACLPHHNGKAGTLTREPLSEISIVCRG